MRAAGLQPDGWQRDLLLLSDAPRVLVLTSRQAGKSTTVAALAAFEAIFRPGSLTLLLSPSLRQSAELFRKVASFYGAIPGAPRLVLDSTLRMELPSGSRVVSLPGTESTIRGYSVDLLVVDEAARVPDSLYHGVRPMLAVSGGRLVALSTPWAKAGWYHAAWTSSEPWERFRVTAADCPRIPAAFLEEERRALPPSVFAREYEATFTDSEDAYFRDSDIERALSSYVEPLFAESLLLPEGEEP